MPSAAEKQHATKLIDSKRRFMQFIDAAYNAKTTLLLFISAYRRPHTFLKISVCGKIYHLDINGLCWRHLVVLDYLRYTVQNALPVVSLSLKLHYFQWIVKQ